jgi:hypothetical protein
MGTGTREKSRVIFPNLLRQTIIHPLPVFMNVCILPVCVHDTEIPQIWLMNEENIGKCLVISMCLVMSSFTLVVVDGKTSSLVIEDF